MLKKFMKYGLIVVGLLIVGLLAAPFFIDVNVYKSQIEKTVEDATGRKLSIGNINASLFPWVGVELDDVKLANRKGFSGDDFVSVKRLHVKLALMPLLSKNVEIQHFEVIAPVIYLQRKTDGTSNWDDLIAAKAAGKTDATAAAGAADAPAAPLLAALQAELLSLEDGEVTWVDGKAKPVVLSDFNVALRDVQLDHPISVDISGKLSGNAFALEAKVGPIGDISKIDPVSLPVQGELKAENIRLQPFKAMISGWPAQLGDINKASIGMTAKIEQRPNGIRSSEGTLQLSADHALNIDWKVEMSKADQLKVNRAVVSVDQKKLVQIKGDVSRLSTNPRFKLRVDGEPIARTWLTTFVPDLKAMYATHPQPWKQLKFSALLAGGTKQMDISDMQLKLDNDLLQASGAVVYKGPDIRLRMSAKQLHLDPWMPQGEQKQAAASWQGISLIRPAIAAAAALAEPDLRFLKSWVVSTRLQVGTLYVRGLDMANFSATINGSGGRFVLRPLSFNLSGGKVTEKASIDVRTYPAKWRESVHITGVQAGPLLKTLADMDMLTGTMAMDTNFRATGLTPDAVKTLNGRGNVLFRDGKIKGFDIAGALRKFTNPTAYKAGPKETDFAQLSGSFKVVNGVVDNRDLFMASPLLRVTGQGKVDLVSKTLDYHVKPRVVGTLQGQGGSMLKKGLTVPLHISGPFADPKVRPEINARTLIDNAPALLNKVNKGKLGGALGGLLGGGNQGGQPASRGGAQIKPQGQPAAPQPASPQQQLMKGLGGLF